MSGLEAVLAAHWCWEPRGYAAVTCVCGWEADLEVSVPQDEQANRHLAAAVREWLRGELAAEGMRQAVAEAHWTAWSLNTAGREGWDDIQAHNRGMSDAVLEATAARLTGEGA